MTNWNLYTIGNYIIGKYPSGNAFNSEEFEQQFNYCQILYLKKQLGLPEEYQPQMPTHRFGYGLTSKSINDLEKFIVTHGYNLSTPFQFTNGVATKPSDLFYWIGMSKPEVEDNIRFNLPIELISRSEFNMRKGSLLKATNEYPVVTLLGGQIAIDPITIKSVNFNYIKYPTPIVVATTINGTTGEEEYDAANSTESEWSEVCNYDILALMLQKIGINIRSAEVVNFGINLEQKGT